MARGYSASKRGTRINASAGQNRVATSVCHLRAAAWGLPKQDAGARALNGCGRCRDSVIHHEELSLLSKSDGNDAQ